MQKIRNNHGYDVPAATLSTWWNPKNRGTRIAANIPQDRRLGMRNDRSAALNDDILDSVQTGKIVTTYLAHNTKSTEYHKSQDASLNTNALFVPFEPFKCSLCAREFKSKVNLDLHIYWHTIIGRSPHDGETSDPDDPHDTDNAKDSHKFVASPGWVKNFAERHDLGHYKMKGEKGSSDYDAVEPWVDDWLSYLYTQYVLEDHKTLRDILTIIVNFDETGIQYKSLPQYVHNNQDITAKNPVINRMTGLFGATATGRKFRALIV